VKRTGGGLDLVLMQYNPLSTLLHELDVAGTEYQNAVERLSRTIRSGIDSRASDPVLLSADQAVTAAQQRYRLALNAYKDYFREYPQREATGETAGKAQVILVVDTDSQRLARTQQILTEGGYRVLSANSAEEAEALADTTAVFDLIICPVVMEGGGESGVHLAEHIERSKRTNSNLLVSHYRRDLLHHIPGFDRQRHFLPNPFSAEELLRRVRDLLVG